MKKRIAGEIIAGLEDALAFAEGRPNDAVAHLGDIDVKAIRDGLGLSQQKFADRYGFSVGRIRDWEQGRTVPDAPSRAFLTVIAREPAAVDRALGAG